MTRTTTGYVIFLSGVGMMLGLMAVEIADLDSWQYVSTPAFVGKTMAHAASVIAAFVGGKMQSTQE